MSSTKEKLLKKQMQKDAKFLEQENVGVAIRVPHTVIPYIKERKTRCYAEPEK